MNVAFFFWQISAITADNVDTYKNAVNKLTDCMDANIKTMYTVMAKTEELSNKMKTTEALAARMFVLNDNIFYSKLLCKCFISWETTIFIYRRDIRRLVDVMDNVA